MAQKLNVTTECDYDGQPVAEGEFVTRHFAVDGKNYELDVCTKHNTQFDNAIGKLIDKSRPVSRHRPRNTAHRRHSADIRTWANRPLSEGGGGHNVSPRGRIPAGIVTEYEVKH